MGCLLVLLGAIAPRVVIAGLALFSDYLARAYDTLLWPLLGFIFLPYTTLAYAWAMNSAGAIQGIWVIVMIVAVLFDLGGWSEGNKHRVRRRA